MKNSEEPDFPELTTINLCTYQKVGYGQMHEGRVDPGGRLSPPPEDEHQHREVADGGNHHHDAIRDNGHFVALIEPHIDRQFRYVAARHLVLFRNFLHLEKTDATCSMCQPEDLQDGDKDE